MPYKELHDKILDGEVEVPSTDKIDPELKAKWVAALRSGEYVQGTAQLKRDVYMGRPEYCCLGVLCEVSLPDKEGWGHSGYIENELVEAIGLPDSWKSEGPHSSFNDEAPQRVLAMMNDSVTYTPQEDGGNSRSFNNDFNTVADFIEKFY